MPDSTPRTVGTGAGAEVSRRRGRPRGTSSAALERVALRLFAEQGFDTTSVEQIAAGAGVSRRTYFRYFDSKAAVLWGEFDQDVTALRSALAAVPDEVPLMTAVRDAVVAVNRYRLADVPELRVRMNLIGSVPALLASAAPHYDAWEAAVAEFAARRLGVPAGALGPVTVGRTTLAACRAAFDAWVARPDGDLTRYLGAALTALGAGFAGETAVVEP